MPSKGSRITRLHAPALSVLGKYDGSDCDNAILKMQQEIDCLRSASPAPVIGITGVTTPPADCRILTDPNAKKILKDMIKEACEAALEPHIGS